MSVRDELRKMLKQGKLAKPNHIPTVAILFDVTEGESPLHVLCLPEQVEEAIDFLYNHEKVTYATSIQLGSHVMGFEKQVKGFLDTKKISKDDVEMKFAVEIESEKRIVDSIDEVVDFVESNTHFEVDSVALRTDLKYLGVNEVLELREDCRIKRLLKLEENTMTDAKKKVAKPVKAVQFYPKKDQASRTLTIHDLDKKIKDLPIADYTLNQLLHGGIELCEYRKGEMKFVPVSTASFNVSNREILESYNYPKHVLDRMTEEEMEAEVEIVQTEGSRLMK